MDYYHISSSRGECLCHTAPQSFCKFEPAAVVAKNSNITTGQYSPSLGAPGDGKYVSVASEYSKILPRLKNLLCFFARDLRKNVFFSICFIILIIK